MSSRWGVLLVGLLLALLGGCTAIAAAIAPAEEQRLASEYFRTIAEARRTADPARVTLPAGTGVPFVVFRQVALASPAVPPRLVGYFTVSGGGERRSRLVYALDDGPRSGLLSVTLVRGDDGPRAGGVEYLPLGRPIDEATRFSLTAGGSAALLLLIPLGAWALSIAAIVRVWRSGRFHRRWLWTLGCLPGLGLLAISWPSGRTGVQLLYLSLFPGGFRQIGPVPDNWLFTATVPVLAIVVLLMRGRPAAGVPAAEEPA